MPPPLFSAATAFLLVLVLLHSVDYMGALTEPNFTTFPGCDATFSCGNIHNLTYPFTGGNRPDHCGPPQFHLTCLKDEHATLNIDSVTYRVLELNLTNKTLVLARADLWDSPCPTTFVNTTIGSKFFNADGGENVDLNIFFGCSTTPLSPMSDEPPVNSTTPLSPMSDEPPVNRFYCDVGGVDVTDSYFLIGEVVFSDPFEDKCLECGRSNGQCGFNVETSEPVCICNSRICIPPPGEVPIDSILRLIHCFKGVKVPLLRSVADELNGSLLTLAEALTRGFEVVFSDPFEDKCLECGRSNGQCGFNVETSEPVCICNSRICIPPPGSSKKGPATIAIILPTVAAILIIVAIAWGIFICKQRKKRRTIKEVHAAHATQTESKAILTTVSSKRLTSASQSNFTSSISSYVSPIKAKDYGRCSYFGAQVFTYEELEVATDYFNDSRELGDGGYGTVYHGILFDGREVAVKRLYENNFKRVEQFMNEVEILTRLDHVNLVMLYGCTSKRSRELLLVYEYISNGTVADHLHGKLAKPNSGLFTWPVRLNIAVETAEALTYLHNSDIIHRDVKTTNILLDKSFRVKVADFGLSRLFPNNATHVSTAPQGTPGYVDPDYYLCYQLTDKSDVYSFGVVLIELISSLQAVDTNRDRLDINLAAMAISKIQNHRLDELVDKSIGFETNGLVRRMITLVAELAFLCLQQESDMRPTMKEVLEILRGIQNDELNAQKPEVLVIMVDDGVLFKDQGTEPTSPEYGVTKKLYGSYMPNSSDD
nr:leaf rust 10 disease-resistance locus receptor-like protein kinase-like 1.4 [Tanacetum cinerariifolium]